MKIGTPVIHSFHGRGEVVVVSPSQAFAVVKYPARTGHYFRTHAVMNLTEAQ